MCSFPPCYPANEKKRRRKKIVQYSHKAFQKGKEEKRITKHRVAGGGYHFRILNQNASFKSALLHNSVFMTVTVLHINPEVMPYDLTTDIKTVKYV